MSGGWVFVDITMPLDGFITGPNDNVEAPLGKGGDRLHRWVYDLASFRRPHGLEGGEELWGDDPPFHNPVFVLTHAPREPLVKQGGTTFTFVTGGIERALELAKAAAGDKEVSIAGGANAIQQYLKAGLLDEMQIHVTHLQFRPPKKPKKKDGGMS